MKDGRKQIIILGAGGRDFHNFNLVYRNDPQVEVVAITATQIPGIDKRSYPVSLAGEHYPNGIPIVPEEELPRLVEEHDIDKIVQEELENISIDSLPDFVDYKQYVQRGTRKWNKMNFNQFSGRTLRVNPGSVMTGFYVAKIKKPLD